MHITDADLPATLSSQLEDDGPVLAAVYARTPTVAGAARWLGPLGNYLVARPAARAKAHDIQERTELPLDAAVVFAQTAGELHVWSADPMLSQVHDHLGSVARTRLVAVETETSKSWWPVTLHLDGGEEVTLEARGDVRAFVDTANG